MKWRKGGKGPAMRKKEGSKKKTASDHYVQNRKKLGKFSQNQKTLSLFLIGRGYLQPPKGTDLTLTSILPSLSPSLVLPHTDTTSCLNFSPPKKLRQERIYKKFESSSFPKPFSWGRSLPPSHLHMTWPRTLAWRRAALSTPASVRLRRRAPTRCPGSIHRAVTATLLRLLSPH